MALKGLYVQLKNRRKPLKFLDLLSQVSITQKDFNRGFETENSDNFPCFKSLVRFRRSLRKVSGGTMLC